MSAQKLCTMGIHPDVGYQLYLPVDISSLSLITFSVKIFKSDTGNKRKKECCQIFMLYKAGNGSEMVGWRESRCTNVR